MGHYMGQGSLRLLAHIPTAVLQAGEEGRRDGSKLRGQLASRGELLFQPFQQLGTEKQTQYGVGGEGSVAKAPYLPSPCSWGFLSPGPLTYSHLPTP